MSRPWQNTWQTEIPWFLQALWCNYTVSIRETHIPFLALTDESGVLEWPGSSVQTHTMVTHGPNTPLSWNQKNIYMILAKLPGYPVLGWLKKWAFQSESKQINRKICINISVSRLFSRTRDWVSFTHLFGEGCNIVVERFRGTDIAVNCHAREVGGVWHRGGIPRRAGGEFTLFKDQGQEWKQRMTAYTQKHTHIKLRKSTLQI